VENNVSLRVIVISQTVYLQAPASYLETIGLTPTQATKYAGQWLAIPASTSGFIWLGATNFPTLVSSLIDLAPPLSAAVTPGGASTPATTLLHGTLPPTAFNLDFGAGETGTVSVNSKSPLVPDRTTYSASSTGNGTYIFTQWGENVVLVAPTGAIPLATAQKH
jgi:hypothetical protein